MTPSNGDDEKGWSAAEERVGSLYRALGYTVTRDTLNRGSQIDLLAERRDPVVGHIRIGVEVKDYPGSSLPIQEVRDFLNNAQLALRREDFVKVHLVTTARLTRNARREAEGEADIRVLTYDELERELLQPDAALEQWLDYYSREPINTRFVDVTATLLGQGPDGDTPSALPSTRLLDIALNDPNLGIVVLADYGSGKSTLLQRIKATAIRRRLSDPSAVVPLLVELNSVTVDLDIEQVALGTCRSELGIDVTADAFWSLLHNGRFLILLDGFDEITLNASAATREHLLARISPLLFGRSPAILTSRPSYFASLDEYRKLISKMQTGLRFGSDIAPDARRIGSHAASLVERYATKGPKVPVELNAQTYELAPLTSEQIDIFLELAAEDLAASGTSPREVRTFLDSVYDLSDLVSRPIILDMAVESTIQGVIDPAQGILQDGPSGLYESYALVRLERDWQSVESRQQFLTHEARMRFAEECALYMDEHDVLRVEPDAISEVAKQVHATGEEQDLESVLTDLRTCSFLTVDDAGSLEFIHRSYQEFFFARRLRSDLLRTAVGRIRDQLRWEYSYFLGAMGYTNADTYQAFRDLSQLRSSSDDWVPDNAAMAVLVAREVARGLDWHDLHLHGLRRPRTQIIESTLKNVMMRDLRVNQVELMDCALDMMLECDDVEEISLTNCTGRVKLFGDVRQISASGGHLDVDAAEGARTVRLESMDLRLRSVGQKHILRNVTGRADIGRSNIDVSRSDLLLASDEAIEGTITDSLVDTDIDTWTKLATRLNRTAIVVKGVRPLGKGATAVRRSRRILEDAPAGSDSAIVIDPSVTADRWWTRQSGLVTIGARIPDARTTMPGLFVFEKERPPNTAARPGSLEFWTNGSTVVVVEGWGAEFEDAVEQLSGAIQRATARSVASGQWFTSSLCPMLEQAGCSRPVAELIPQLVTARVNASGPNPRS